MPLSVDTRREKEAIAAQGNRHYRAHTFRTAARLFADIDHFFARRAALQRIINIITAHR